MLWTGNVRGRLADIKGLGHPREVLRGYRFRLSPTPTQEKALEHTLDLLRWLYNAALEERREAYRKQGKSITKREQEKEITEIKRDCPEYEEVHTHLLQDVVKRLDTAFQAFFRRLKEGAAKPGFPRFKGRERYNSFTYKDAGNGNGAAMVSGGKRIRLSGIGNVKIKVHREMKGTLKTVKVKRDSDGHWYALLTCEVPTRPLPATHREVGIDVGITTFAATSDGELIENPRPMQTARIRVERAQRKVSRRTKGSKRRSKARALLAKAHAHVRDVRKDFHHRTARRIVKEYDHIAVEDLNIKGLAGGMLAKPVHDAGWGQFITILTEKAEDAARVLARVDPRGTSQECSDCGEVVRKDLSVRVHRCPHCGLVLDRDVNAARNIHWRAFAPTRPGRGPRGAAPA